MITREDGTFSRRGAIGSNNEEDNLRLFEVNLAWVPEVICSAWQKEARSFGYLEQIEELPPSVVVLSSIEVTLDKSLGEPVQPTESLPSNKETGS